MGDPPGTLPLRCFCARHPLLAVCGRDKKSNEPYIHVKTWKNQRLYAEVIMTGVGSTIRIRCRECLRWHSVKIAISRVSMVEEALPETILV